MGTGETGLLSSAPTMPPPALEGSRRRARAHADNGSCVWAKPPVSARRNESSTRPRPSVMQKAIVGIGRAHQESSTTFNRQILSRRSRHRPQLRCKVLRDRASFGIEQFGHRRTPSHGRSHKPLGRPRPPSGNEEYSPDLFCRPGRSGQRHRISDKRRRSTTRRFQPRWLQGALPRRPASHTGVHGRMMLN